MKQNRFHVNLDENIGEIKQYMGGSDDLIVRRFRIEGEGSQGETGAAAIYFEGLADQKEIQQFVIEPLMLYGDLPQAGDKSGQMLLDRLSGSVLTVGRLEKVDMLEAAVEAMMNGSVVVMLDGCSSGLQMPMPGHEHRPVSEPTNQTVVRGPKEAFTENIGINIALIRRIVKSPNLTLRSRSIGTVTKTKVGVMYIRGLVDEEALREMNRRLDSIDTDAILESGYIEEFIQDEPYTIFPTMQNTERPDVVSASLLEGRIAVLVDGTPHVLLAPSLFVQFFQAAEDYYQRADISTLIRALRYFSMFIALLVPSLYIAVTTYHQEMLPTQLLISLAAQREGVPFPAFVEAIIMEATYEILREAGLRMPRVVGQAVSIVGTLVIGQAAVEAGIISASMIIVVSITAIASYVIPQFDMSIAIRISRFAFMGLAAAFGMYGIFIGMSAMLLHLSSLRSFGVPYMTPIGPINLGDQKDVILRVRHPNMTTRPSMFSKLNPVRGRRPKRKDRA